MITPKAIFLVLLIYTLKTAIQQASQLLKTPTKKSKKALILCIMVILLSLILIYGLSILSTAQELEYILPIMAMSYLAAYQ